MEPTFALLASLVDDDLTVSAAQEVTVTLRVARAEPDPTGHGGSVLLTGPRDPALAQGTYPVDHETHGRGLLFLVPLAEDGSTRTYEAVFG